MASTVQTAVFPAAGMGTRFLPATKSVPKEMLPVVDRPLIQYAVDEARAAGIEKLVVVTGRGGQAIENYLDPDVELGKRLAAKGKRAEIAALERGLPPPGAVAYARQDEPRGLGHAVGCARHLVGDGAFAVLLADDLIVAEPGCIAQMMAAHARLGGIVVAAMEVARQETGRYGIVEAGTVEGRVVEVRGLVEKPDPERTPSTLAVIGRYILVPEVFEHLARCAPGRGARFSSPTRSPLRSAPCRSTRIGLRVGAMIAVSRRGSSRPPSRSLCRAMTCARQPLPPCGRHSNPRE